MYYLLKVILVMLLLGFGLGNVCYYTILPDNPLRLLGIPAATIGFCIWMYELNSIKENKMFGTKKEPEFKFNLGDKVKDLITPFEGIVIGRHQWLNNCNTYSVKPQTLKDGAPQDNQSFDEPQLEIVEVKVAKENRKTGGPERKVSQPNR